MICILGDRRRKSTLSKRQWMQRGDDIPKFTQVVKIKMFALEKPPTQPHLQVVPVVETQ